MSTYQNAVDSLVNGAQMASWYALQTHARHEKVVAARLQEQGFESFLPLVTEVHQWRDRKKRVDLPLFSCYVFVNFALTNESWYRVCNINGVCSFVGVRGQGISIPDDQIAAVQKLLSEDLPWSNHPFLKIGQRVRVRGGSLDGLEGILTARDGDQTLVISVDAIQRSLAVRINGYDVEPA